MSTEAPYTPHRFEDYIVGRPHLGRQRCDNCFREDLNCWEANNAAWCEVCERAYHASSLEKERMVHAMLAGAIRGALKAGAPIELVQAIVADVFAQADHDEIGDMGWTPPRGRA